MVAQLVDKEVAGKGMAKKESGSKRESAKEAAAKANGANAKGGKRDKGSDESPMEALYRENSNLRNAVQQIEKAFGGGDHATG